MLSNNGVRFDHVNGENGSFSIDITHDSYNSFMSILLALFELDEDHGYTCARLCGCLATHLSACLAVIAVV